MLSFVKRITRGGPHAFIRRLYHSVFGFVTLKRIIFASITRRKLLKRLLSENIKNNTRSAPHLGSRRELQALLGAPALINDQEISVFEKYAPSAEKNIVEIGSAFGGSSLLFLINKSDNTRLYSIDPFVKDSMGEFQASEEICYKSVVGALRKLGFADRIQSWALVSDYSFNFIKNWKDTIDILFIDGDHRYDSVKRDYEEWLGYIKPGGYIFFHDSCRPDGISNDIYVMGWPGPSRLVKEIVARSRDVNLVEQVCSISVFKKHE